VTPSEHVIPKENEPVALSLVGGSFVEGAPNAGFASLFLQASWHWPREEGHYQGTAGKWPGLSCLEKF
jgi:hypothetical protein